MKSIKTSTLAASALLGLTLAAPALAAETTNPGVPPAKREFIEWTDVWIPGADKSDKPKVLLIGDSITKGYYGKVDALLKADAYTARLATSLCAADPAFLPTLEAVLMQTNFDVIHFNNGLHGVDYTEEQYADGYRAALETIRKLQPKAKIIVTLSTPLKKGSPKESLNPRIDERNRIAEKLAKEFHAAIDDLNTPMRKHPEYHRDPYHYKAPAIAIQAEQVAKSVRAALKKHQ